MTLQRHYIESFLALYGVSFLLSFTYRRTQNSGIPATPNGFSVPSYSFLEVLTVHEEQFFISMGCPLEDAVTMCHSMRREGILDEFVKETQTNCSNRHWFRCKSVCTDCQCKNSGR